KGQHTDMNQTKGFEFLRLPSLPRIAGVLALTAAVSVTSGCLVIKDISQPRVDSSEVRQPREPVRFSMTTERDVDTAYVRLKRTFGFRTLDEIAPPGNNNRDWIVLDAGYHHRTTPGVHYSMRERRDINGESGIIQIDVDRDGSGSYLEVVYYSGGEHAFPLGDDFQQNVKAKIEDALR
ncbi:MAG: hypothetical protein WD208_05385, partial [Dehalococcoidia bacterium]